MADVVTIKDLYDWINAGGLNPQTILFLDGDGTLMADVPGKTAVTYLHIGFCDAGSQEDGDLIDGEPGQVGDLVFWGDRRPWWIVEWQPDNGRVFVVVDAAGTIGTATASELTKDFRKAGGT